MTHPVTQAVARSLKSVARLVRPVSQSLVVHRLAARFVAVPWLRILLQVLTLPFVIAPVLTVQVGRHLRPVPAVPRSDSTGGAGSPDGMEPTTSGPVTDTAPDGAHGWDELLTPGNRAERRAQQQAHANSKRARARH